MGEVRVGGREETKKEAGSNWSEATFFHTLDRKPVNRRAGKIRAGVLSPARAHRSTNIAIIEFAREDCALFFYLN